MVTASLKALSLVIASLSAASCTTIVTGEGPRRELVSVGITRVIVPERKGELAAVRRTGLGFGFGDAVGSAAWLGFDSSEWVIADPASCQLLVVIRNDAEAENAARILDSLKGENICYVKDI